MRLKGRTRAVLTLAALCVSTTVVVGLPAAAENGCWATASGNYTYDHASTYQPAGSCKVHKIQGEWFVIGDPNTPYYETGTRFDVPPGGTKYVGYSLPSQYQLQRFRFCSHLSNISCTYNAWQT